MKFGRELLIYGKKCVMIDFLFLYEHRARELENSVYLSLPLEKKGYKVKIESMASFKKKFYKPRVVVVPHLYNESDTDFYTSFFSKKHRVKVISMQYEQNLPRNHFQDEFHRPKGFAKRGFHVAWGQKEYEKYLSNGIDEKNILRLGCIGIDFDTEQYRDYLLPKERLAKENNIDVQKKWIVFFSSFSAVGKNFNDEDIELIKSRKEQEAMQDKLIDWFDKVLSSDKFSDYLIIYRNHPSEILRNGIQELTKKYSSRFVIKDDYTIRHWINVSDLCMTVSSTTHVDAYFMGKNCLILRPIPVGKQADIYSLEGTSYIARFEQLCDAVELNEKNTNVETNSIIQYIYDNRINETVIDRYITAFEQVYHDKTGRGEFVSRGFKFRTSLAQDALGIICDLSHHFRLARLFKWSKRVARPAEIYEREVYRVRDDIITYKKRMRSTIMRTQDF